MLWLAKRIARFITALWAVITVTFFIVQLMPGGPAAYIRAQLISQGVPRSVVDTRLQAYLNFNPDAPIHIQYLDYMHTLIVEQSLGESIVLGAPVTELIANSLPYTVFVMSQALILSYIIGISLGAVMAFFEGTRFDTTSSIMSTILSSVPYYIVGLLLLYFFASGTYLEIFPTGTAYSASVYPGLNLSFVVSLYLHAALPILSMALAAFGGRALAMRANSISVLESEFIKSGRIRGLGTWRLASRYVARNAILPMYTGFMISVGFMFGGAVIVEEIFAYPGVGSLILEATKSRDFPLLIGALIVISTVVLLLISVAEITYGLIDPRVQSKNADGGDFLSYTRLKSSVQKLFRNHGQSDPGRKPTDPNHEFHMRQAGDLPDSIELPRVGTSSKSYYQDTFDRSVVAPIKILLDDWRGKFGITVLLIYFLGATLGVYLTKSPTMNSAPSGILPFQTMKYPLGTGGFGQDLLAEMLHATPPMFKLLIAGSVFSTGVATLIGTASGFSHGNPLDRILMFLTDVQLVVPGLPLILVITALFEPKNPFVVGVMLSIDSWPGLARNVRSEVLSIRELNFVKTSSIMGLSFPNIMRRDLLPNVMPYILISFAGSARNIIYNSIALYFLGVLPFSQANWGVVLNDAYTSGAMWNAGLLHWLLIPMITVVVFTLAIILLSQSADKLYNPRLRAQKVKSESTAGDEPKNPRATAD